MTAYLPKLSVITVRANGAISSSVHYRDLGVPCRVTRQGSVMCEPKTSGNDSRDDICVVSTDWLEID
jgi:hypothetical protein